MAVELPKGRADTRMLLLAAAAACVEQYGVEKTTLEDVARRAEVSRPTVYRYFKDRDDLVLAVVLGRARRVLEDGHEFLETQSSLREALVEGLLFLVERGRGDPYVEMMVNAPGRGRDPGAARRQAAFLEWTTTLWSLVLTRAQQSGELEGRSLDRIYLWLNGLMLLLVGRPDALPQESADLRSLIEEFVLPAFASVTAPTA